MTGKKDAKMMTLEKFEEASELVKKVTNPTKLIYSDYLSEASGAKVYLKPENMQHTGAYKIRGAYYKISTLTEEERKRALRDGGKPSALPAADSRVASMRRPQFRVGVRGDRVGVVLRAPTVCAGSLGVAAQGSGRRRDGGSSSIRRE